MVYDNSERPSRTYGNNGPGAVLNTISFVGIVAGFLLIINRLYWRWRKGTPGIDDLIIVLAWIVLFVLGVVTYIAVDYGYGRPSAQLTPAEASNAIRMFYLYQIFYKLTLNLSKLSILVLYLRVFDTHDWFGKITKFLIGLVVSFSFSIIVTNIFMCTPVNMYWDTLADEATHRERCINVLGYWYASSLYNILSEALILFSVLVRIWTLPSNSQPPILHFRQKVNLTVVLGLGIFTLLCAIFRVTTLSDAALAADKTGGTLLSTRWSSIEACLGLAVANLPMLRQLLRWRGWCGGRWFGSSADKSRSRGNSHSRRLSSYTPTFRNNSRGHHSQTMAGAMGSRRPIAENAHGGIMVTRDFRLDVVPSDNSSESSITDLEAQPFRHLEYSSQKSLDPFRSPLTSPSKSARFTETTINEPRYSEASLKASTIDSSIRSSTIVGGTEITSKSATPSVASTLRSPTEPLPIVRIASDLDKDGSIRSNMAATRSPGLTGDSDVHLQPISACHIRCERRSSSGTA